MAKKDSRSKVKTRGRPPGIKFTQDQQQIILGLIERGATDHAAAQAAGIAPRTFRELRQRAEARHPKRGPLPQLARFFQQVDEASARARVKREIEVAESDPRHWLANQARSKPGLDGWTEPIPEPPDVSVIHVPTSEDISSVVAELISSGAILGPRCADPSCTCALHASMGSDDDD